MRSVKIREVLTFLKGKTLPIFNEMSNNDTREWIVRKLRSNNLYFIFENNTLVGLVEWYRYRNYEELIWDFKAGKLYGSEGVILYINNFIVNKGYLTGSVLKRFVRYTKNQGSLEHYFRMIYKNKYRIKEIKLRR